MTCLIILRVTAKVILTINNDIDDRLMNEQIGSIEDFKFQEQQVVMNYIQFDDQQAGLRKMAKDLVIRGNRWALHL